MSDGTSTGAPAYKILSRVAIYIVLLAWILLGFYVFSIAEGFGKSILDFFLSTEQAGVKFRALILLAPFALTLLGYLINDRAQLFKKTLLAEEELRKRAAELEEVNALLTQENNERKKAEEKLTYQAFYDSLTNLPNRSLFIDRLQNSLERQKRYPDHSFAVLFLDLDRFKIINDSLGHIIGDQLLTMLAKRLKKHIRSVDTIARFGGDEFAVLLEDAKESGLVNCIVDRIMGEMKSPIAVFGHEIFVTASMGIVVSNTADYKRPDEILRDADTAMYNAKARGKACYAFFDSAMHAQATTVLRLETELRKAVERHEFILYYQPIIAVKDNKIIGFEALVRWKHPERGIINPAEFIIVAEETGLILSIGEWVIREACAQLRVWQEQFREYGDLTVSVNVSSKVFSQQNFYEIVEKILKETGLDGSCLRLEIVERMLIEDPEPAADLIKRFSNLSVRFDIDDFGTGYSALNYLRHFPIRGLKIDGSFINALTFDQNNREIVRTIVDLGNTLGLDVIAEGVETIEQLDIYKTMKGGYVQGFYLFRPMDSNQAENLLAANNLVARQISAE
jgi:diguanylate cyclase (GGDEF)-like protein